MRVILFALLVATGLYLLLASLSPQYLPRIDCWMGCGRVEVVTVDLGPGDKFDIPIGYFAGGKSYSSTKALQHDAAVVFALYPGFSPAGEYSTSLDKPDKVDIVLSRERCSERRPCEIWENEPGALGDNRLTACRVPVIAPDPKFPTREYKISRKGVAGTSSCRERTDEIVNPHCQIRFCLKEDIAAVITFKAALEGEQVKILDATEAFLDKMRKRPPS